MALLGSLLFGCGGPEVQEPPKDLILALQDTQVTLQDFRDWVGMNVPSVRYEDLSDQARSRLLDQMLEEKILLHAAGQAGIRVEDAEVEAYIRELGAREEERDPEFRRLVAERLAVKRFREEYLLKDLIVGEDEIQAWYDERKEAYEEPERYVIRHIFLESEKAIRKAWDRLEAGEPFERVAAEWNSAPRREKPSLVSTESLLPALGEALVALKPGQHTGVVQTPEGYHILKLEEVRAGGARSLDSVRDRAEMDLLKARSSQRIEEVIALMAGQEPFLFMPENLDFTYVP